MDSPAVSCQQGPLAALGCVHYSYIRACALVWLCSLSDSGLESRTMELCLGGMGALPAVLDLSVCIVQYCVHYVY